MEDKIIEAIVTDEELFLYIERLVRKRLPQGPKLKSEVMWYKQVVDYSINQAFEDLQIVDILNYQISQLGKYLKKKQQQERQQMNGDSPEDVFVIERNDRGESIQPSVMQASSFTSRITDESTEQPMLLSDAHGDENHHIRQPQYSDSEPTLQTAGSRRRKGSGSSSSTEAATTSTRTPSVIPPSQSTTTTTALSSRTSAVIDMTTTANRTKQDEEEENEEIENAKLQRALEIAKRYSIGIDPPEVVITHPVPLAIPAPALSAVGVSSALTMKDAGSESTTLLSSPTQLPTHNTTTEGSFSPAPSPVMSTSGSPDRSPGGVVDLGTCLLPTSYLLLLVATIVSPMLIVLMIHLPNTFLFCVLFHRL